MHSWLYTVYDVKGLTKVYREDLNKVVMDIFVWR